MIRLSSNHPVAVIREYIFQIQRGFLVVNQIKGIGKSEN
ncbi:hypothetical protein BLGI_249 [Brevibacillus laterosporus GI-9]|nr:hypothetical protein BLGI_249 [Brevibacillus laterosporus GI-9]